MKYIKKYYLTQSTKIFFLLFFMFFFLSFFWQSIVPTASEAPDEKQHTQIVYFLKKFKKIPVFDQEDEIFKTYFYSDGSHGIVYYSMAYNPPLTYLPYILLAKGSDNLDSKQIVFPMRIISGLAFGLFAGFLFLALSKFNKGKKYLALGIALFISLIPQIIFTSSYVNIDPLSLMLSALSFYLVSKINLNSEKKEYIFLGISLGLLALSKANYLIVVFFILSLAIFKIMKSTSEKKTKYSKILLLLVPLIALNSWWWIRNLILFNDPLIINHISSTIKASAPDWFLSPSQEGANFFNIINHRYAGRTIFYGFYAFLGAFKVLLPLVFYYIFYLYLFFVFSVGLVIIMIRKKSEIGLFIFSTSIIFISYLVFINKNLTDFSPQGRHLFPLLVPLSLVLLLSIRNWAKMIKKYILQIMIIFSLLANFYAILFFVRDYYIIGSGWALTDDWSLRIAKNFSYHNFSVENYQNLYRSIYSDSPAYWGYLSLLSLVLFLLLFITLFIKFTKSYDEKC